MNKDLVTRTLADNSTIIKISLLLLLVLLANNHLSKLQAADKLLQADLTLTEYAAQPVTISSNNQDSRIAEDSDASSDVSSLDNTSKPIIKGNVNNNTLKGSDADDTLYGGAGDDILDGGKGDDTIYGGAGDDRLDGGPGNDILIGGAGNDILGGEDWGADWLVLATYIYRGNSYQGGVGNDTLRGTFHGDTYIFNLGDGVDTIIERGGSGDFFEGDILQFGEGITADQINITSSGDDLVFSHINGTDRVIVQNWYSEDDNQLEEIQFSDGYKLDRYDLQRQFPKPPTKLEQAQDMVNLIHDYGQAGQLERMQASYKDLKVLVAANAYLDLVVQQLIADVSLINAYVKANKLKEAKAAYQQLRELVASHRHRFYRRDSITELVLYEALGASHLMVAYNEAGKTKQAEILQQQLAQMLQSHPAAEQRLAAELANNK